MPPWMFRAILAALALAVVGGAVAATLALFPDESDRPASGESVVLLAAGDIGDCEQPGDEATVDVLARHPDAVIAALGDQAYQHGSPSDYARCYHPTWGRFKDRTRPVPGNHEYGTQGAAGYYAYFGKTAGDPEEGWYSYDHGPWHLVALNSECRRVGGCEPNEPQAAWLAEDLRRNSEPCTLAYFHRPPFTSGRYGDDIRHLERMRVLWRVLYEHGVDVVLVGHEHSYERFVPMDAEGGEDPDGMRLFVVGTGGGNLRTYRGPRLLTTAIRNDDTWGVLKLTLHPTRYEWEFVRAGGGTFADSGSGSCR